MVANIGTWMQRTAQDWLVLTCALFRGKAGYCCPLSMAAIVGGVRLSSSPAANKGREPQGNLAADTGKNFRF